MTLFAAAADLPELATGGPKLLLVGDVARPPLPGISAWRVTGREGGWALHRDAAPAGHAVVLPAAPSGVIALLAADPAAAASLRTAWGEAPPPILDAAAGSPFAALAEVLGAALGARAVEAAGLHAALVAARAAAEDTRRAMAALLAGTGRHPPPAPPLLAVDHLPGATPPLVPDRDGRLAIAAIPGVSLQGVAAVALHLDVAACGAGSALRVRLFGAESRQLHGAWTLPGQGLAPGWCVLDLPAPIGPVRETACLEAVAAVAPGDRLALSTATEGAPGVVAGGDATGAGACLALRLWTAPFGRRFVQAAHWDAASVGLELPAPGVPVGLPEAIWGTAPAGPALGEEPARPAATLAAGSALLWTLPAVPLAGLDRIEARIAVPLGDATDLEAALWLQPVGAAPADDAALTLLTPVARWSGWRRGALAAAGLTVPLVLPPTLPGWVAVVLSLRHRGGDALRVRWDELLGFRETVALPAAPGGAAPAPLVAAAVPADAVPSVAAARLEERFVAADGHYRHLDISVAELAYGTLGWPAVRFKLAIGGEAPVLEFRQRPDWPLQFETWPGRDADAHGPFWLADAAALGGGGLGWRDRQLLSALRRVLPSVVATAAREAAADLDEYRDWGELARRLAAG